jgi:hypothetical protein
MKPTLGSLIGVGVVGVTAVIIGLVQSSPVPWIIALIVTIVLIVMLAKHRGSTTVPFPLDKFNEMWTRWLRVHGEPAGLIVRKEKTKPKKPVESDIGDYSFDRAVVCDRARTVDLLLANNFHFENNCAVLSVGGYPLGPFETVRAMLKRNPRLQVFALHDATSDGCTLAHRLATNPGWFQGQVRVTDVGLRPVHSKPFTGLLLRSAGMVMAGNGITPEEASWLSHYSLELAAIRPEQVLKRLFKAINRKTELEPDDEDGAGYYFTDTTGTGHYDDREDEPGQDESDVDFDADSFSADAADSDGGADSFG